MTPEQKSWKERIDKVKMTQRELSILTDVPQSVMCLYLNCKREPLATTFRAIETAIKERENNAVDK